MRCLPCGRLLSSALSSDACCCGTCVSPPFSTSCLLLQAVCIIQTLDDAEALLFLDKNFNELFNRMPADEVAVVCKRELSRLSQVCGRYCAAAVSVSTGAASFSTLTAHRLMRA